MVETVSTRTSAFICQWAVAQTYSNPRSPMGCWPDSIARAPDLSAGGSTSSPIVCAVATLAGAAAKKSMGGRPFGRSRVCVVPPR